MSLFQKIDNKLEYQGLLEKAFFKTFFHDLEWEGFLEKEFNWLNFEHYLYKDEALLSLARYKILSGEKLVSHPFCEYGGPLVLKESIEGRDFKKEIFSNFKEPLKINFHPQIPKYFKELGLKETDSSRDSYFIENLDKVTAEQLYSGFRKTLRHSIKKSQQQNLKIKECERKEELRFFYNLYLKSAKRHKNIAYPFSFFRYFLNSKKAEIILAENNGKIIAGSIFLFYGKFIHYFINASDKKYKDLGANYLILWDQIKKYRGGKYQIFDLGGTKRGSGLEIFKKGWAAKRYPIFEIKNFDKEKLKSSKLRNLIPFFPDYLYGKLIPYLLKYKL